jgi:hypothetical protein
MTPEQNRFVRFHTQRLVTSWRWIFQGGSLRACTDRGESATISRAGIEGLIFAGVAEWYSEGAEAAGVRIRERQVA